MSTLKEMAEEYKLAASKLAMSIARHERAGDRTPAELESMRLALRGIREAAYLLSGYYDDPRPYNRITLQGIMPKEGKEDG